MRGSGGSPGEKEVRAGHPEGEHHSERMGDELSIAYLAKKGQNVVWRRKEREHGYTGSQERPGTPVHDMDPV